MARDRSYFKVSPDDLDGPVDSVEEHVCVESKPKSTHTCTETLGPNCRGFTSDEIAKINFDTRDISPIYADLGPVIPDQKVLKRNITNRLENMRAGLKDRSAM